MSPLHPSIHSSIYSNLAWVPNLAQETVPANTWPLPPSFGYCNPTLSDSLTSLAIPLYLYSFNQQVFIDSLLWTKHCFGGRAYRSRLDIVPFPKAFIICKYKQVNGQQYTVTRAMAGELQSLKDTRLFHFLRIPPWILLISPRYNFLGDLGWSHPLL